MQIPWFKPPPIELPLPDAVPEQFRYVHPFGVCVALAVLVGANVAIRRARSEGIHPRVMGEMAGYVLFGGFVFGHVFDAIFYHWDIVREDPWFVLQLWNGLSSFGGFIGATIGGLVWIAHRGYPLVPFADVTSWAFPFGWVFGRLGCFLVHDHPGVVTDFPLAVADYRVRGGSPPWQTRHDLGLYEVFWCLAVIPLFLWLGREKRPRGFYFALLPLLYAPVRFGLDFLRASDLEGGDPRILFGLTPGHYGALLLFAGGLSVLYHVHRKGGRFELPREARWTAEDEGRADPRSMEQLLATVGEPRGARRVPAPEAEHGGVQRWPGGALVIDAAAENLAEAIEALGPARHHVWNIDGADLEVVARLVRAYPAEERDVAVVTEGDVDPADVAAALGVPVFTASPEAPAWSVVERDDGGIVFGTIGPPAAEPG